MKPMIFLIGMPGAGKTVWGKRLAAYYHWLHTDLDEVIEHTTGTTIARIFETEGEPAFRRHEQAVLQGVIHTAQQPVVVSCGGGTPLFQDNLEQMKRHGPVVFLDATIDTLIRHLQGESVKRPLLANGDIISKLTGLLAKREPVYRQADHIFKVEDLTEATFAEIFATCTNRH